MTKSKGNLKLSENPDLVRFCDSEIDMVVLGDTLTPMPMPNEAETESPGFTGSFSSLYVNVDD